MIMMHSKALLLPTYGSSDGSLRPCGSFRMKAMP
jgi:hypothetical protein